MTTQYTPILKLALPVTGELSGTWGTVVNDNITSMVEQAVAGLSTINTWTANAHTLTTADGTSSEARCAMLVLATGAGGTALTAAGEVICPAASKLYVVKNGSAYAVTVKTSAGTGVAIPAGDTAFVFCDGTNVNACVTTIVNGHISGNLTVDGNTTLGDATSDTITATARFNTDLLPSTDNARDLGSTANSWRTLYCDTSVLTPLVTATNLQVTNIKANDGTAVAVLTDSTGATDFSKAFTLSAIAQNISLGASQTTGTFVLGGTAATGAITLDASTKAHTLNIGSGATENATTKTINIGTGGVSGSTTTMTIGSANGTTITLNGTVTAATFNSTTIDTTNLEVTNIKAKDGSASITLADSTGVATFSANPILNAGTANGVVYLNASKVATTGSALTFDGSEIFKNSGGTIQNNDVRGSAAAGTRLSAGGTLGVDSFDLFQNAVGGYVFNRGNTPLIFGANNAEKMRLTSTGTLNIVGAGTAGSTQAISFNGSTPVDTLVTTSAGNVGIGTSSPAGKLHVTGVAYFGNTGASDTQLRLGPLDASNAYFQSVSADGATGKGMIFYVGSTSMTLNSSGNLGLGVTPETWTYFNVFRFGQTGGLFGDPSNTETNISSNTYHSSGFKYITAQAASYYRQYNGSHAWFRSTSTPVIGNDPSFTQAMTLDASGNLGVGTTSPASGTRITIDNSGFNSFLLRSSGVDRISLYGDAAVSAVDGKANPLAFYAGSAERARITSGGDLLVGTNAAAVTSKLDVLQTTAATAGIGCKATNSNAQCFVAWNSDTSGDNIFAQFYTETSATSRGSITYNRAGGLVAYNTTSDYRAKDILAPVADSGTTIDALKVYNGKMKGATVERPMLIAHEAQAVTPYAVTGEKDAVNDDGTPKYQQMDVSSLVPLLIAEIQSLRARVAQLESKGA